MSYFLEFLPELPKQWCQDWIALSKLLCQTCLDEIILWQYSKVQFLSWDCSLEIVLLRLSSWDFSFKFVFMNEICQDCPFKIILYRPTDIVLLRLSWHDYPGDIILGRLIQPHPPEKIALKIVIILWLFFRMYFDFNGLPKDYVFVFLIQLNLSWRKL